MNLLVPVLKSNTPGFQFDWGAGDMPGDVPGPDVGHYGENPVGILRGIAHLPGQLGYAGAHREQFASRIAPMIKRGRCIILAVSLKHLLQRLHAGDRAERPHDLASYHRSGN